MFRKSSNNQAREVAALAPANANKENKKAASPSIIASDVNILGNLVSEGSVDIDGKVDGTVKATHITIRSNGVIKGDLIADVVHIYGEVKGVIKAKTVAMFASCRVEGIIMHESLTIEDGAFVDGKFKRSDKVSAANDDESEAYEETSPMLMDGVPKGMAFFDNIKLVSG